MTIVPPPILSRKIGRVELWPTGMLYRREGEKLVGEVTSWGVKPGKEPPPEKPRSRRGVAQQAFDL